MLNELAPTLQEKAALEYVWRGFSARPKQLAPPGDWLIWLILAGRGFGKTKTGAEWIREQVGPRHVRSTLRIALVGRTAADIRDVMVDGESGILAISPPWNRPEWQPSKRRLMWPNGARATTYSADEPKQMRGPQYHIAWCDELCAWRYEDAWTQLRLGNRLPNVRTRFVVTTTPTPTDLLKSLMAEETTVLTRGSTFENTSNLSPQYITTIRREYEGTRLGRQELYAEVLDDTPGALWTRKMIDEAFLRKVDKKILTRIVVAIDPSVSSADGSAETGIVVVGVDDNEHGYVLEDLSDVYSPNRWAEVAVEAYHRWDADRIVAEVNQGGDLVETTIRSVDNNVAYRAVHASKGKYARAEPVAALYEQHRVHHVGAFSKLESQQCTYVPGVSKKSPDRLDAAVWGLTDLMLDVTPGGGGMIAIRSTR